MGRVSSDPGSQPGVSGGEAWVGNPSSCKWGFSLAWRDPLCGWSLFQPGHLGLLGHLSLGLSFPSS